MKKRNIVISTMLSMVMFTLSTASAAEGAVEYIKSDSFANAVDVAVNTLNELGDDISGAVGEIFQAEPEESIDKAAVARTKTDWDTEDIISLYEEGYALEDIGTAMKLAPELGTKPYTLLEKKGKPSYEAHELTAEEAVLAKQARTPRNAAELAAQQVVDAQAVLTPEEVLTAEAVLQEETASVQNQPIQMAEEQVQYAMEKVEEKSWETVIAEVQGDTVAADPDMQTIKENGFLEFIDESMLTDGELQYLNDAEEEEISLMAVNSSVDDEIIDIYNNVIFPTSLYSQYNAGNVHSSNEDVEVNPLSKTATVRATDLTLTGKNGLDLTLTRVNSGMNVGTLRPIVHKTYGDTTTFSSYFYSVTGYARVTVEYNEPLPNGQYSETFDSEEIMFKPYDYKIGVQTEYDIASREALLADRARLADGRMPTSMFTNRSDAQEARQEALAGKYDKKYTFGSGFKVKSIEFEVIDDLDIVVVNEEGYKTVETTEDYEDIYITDWYDYTVTEQYANIGVGWEFDFPYIERLYSNTTGGQGNQDYLHFGAKGVWRIDDDYNLDGYYLNDIEVSAGGEFDGEDCYMTVTEKDGKKYYFGDLGELLGIEDRYGNQITFEYNTIQRYDGHKFPYQIAKIVDSVGREITFNYTNPLQTVITVTDKNDSTQNRVIKYNKELVLDLGEDSEYVLSSVIDAENNETVYTYETFTTETSLTSKTFDYNDYIEVPQYYITSILKPSKMQIRLLTQLRESNCGNDGIASFAKIMRYEYGEPNNETLTRFRTYIYKAFNFGNPIQYDGYPEYRNKNEMPPELQIYTKSEEMIWSGQSKYTTQEYARSEKDNWICVTQTVTTENYDPRENLQRERIDYTYNDREQCIKEEYKKFNDPDDQSEYQSLVTEYTYDSGHYNDILKLKRFGSEEYAINYEYDDTYHIPTKRTFKQDADTTVVENYTLTDDNKSVASVQVTENNATKRKVDYTYDSYGNVLTEKRYTGANNWNDFMQVNYSYSDLSDRTNKINDTYLSKISVSGVKDVDGNLVAAQPGGTAGTIEYTYTYDWFGNVLTETDGNGNTYSYTYDKLNRPTQMKNPEQGTIGLSYGIGYQNNYVQVTDENGNVMKYSYLSTGAISEEKDVTANKVLRSYNYTYHEYPFTSQTEVTAYSDYGNTTLTTTLSDAFGRPIETEVTDEDDNVVYREEYTYELAVDNLYDRVTKTVKGATEAEDYTVRQYTDKFGNLVKEEVVYRNNGTPQNLTTEYTYDYAGNLLTVKSPRATAESWTDSVYTAQYEYDIDGQVTKITDIYGNYSINEYDGLGRLVRSADAEATAAQTPYYSTFTYDVLGRLLKEQIPYDNSGTSVLYGENKYYYDNNGNVIKAMTKNGSGTDDYSVSETTYNWRNAPVKVLTDGTDSAYYYDAVGNALRMYTGDLTDFTISGLDNVSGGEYEVTKYTYDSQNRPVSTTDALGQTSTNTYDINGNIIKTVDRNQNILNSVYDPMGNLTEKSAQTSAEAAKENVYTYTYNRMGMPLTMTGNGITTSYTYDNLGRLTKESLTDGTQKEYNYDSDGNRTQFKLTVNGVEQMNTSYTYDKLDRLATVTNGTVTSSYTYNKNGQLLTDTTGGFTTTYSYNAGGMITNLTTNNGTSRLQSHSYQYLPNGNISQKQSMVGTQSTQYNYQYDDAGRLTQEQYGGDTKAYSYDAFGNRSQMTVSGTQSLTENYTYDSNNRLTKLTRSGTDVNEEVNYTYDANGNQLSWNRSVYTQTGTPGISFETDGNDFGIYGYDLYNRVTSYTNGVTNANYTYDGNNLRQTKTVDGVTTSHIWDGQNMAMETVGTVVNKYYRGANGLVYGEISGTVSYYLKDAHGDTTALADASGTITKNYLYDAFGNEQTEDAADTNPFRYSGEYFDAESGNIYLRNRYYDASTGRFISEDPILDGTNWYVYAGNNPILFIDPFGLTEPGDENRSEGAQIYIEYYTEYWKYFDAGYQNATNDFDRIVSAVAREIAHQMADDIRRLDDEGKVEGVKLNVPVYNQLDVSNGDNLCWATCAAMWISYILGDTTDRKVDIAIAVAQDMINQGLESGVATDPAVYNVPREWFSTDYIAGLLGLSGVASSQTQNPGNLSMTEIKMTILVDSPFAVLYGNYDSNNIWSGHWVLGIGYAIAPGHNPLVVSNDPWGGVQRIQTYDDFQTYDDGKYWAWTAK